MKTACNDYQIACENIAEAFQERYYPDYELKYCVAGDVTGVWEICDNYFCVNKMYEFMFYDYSRDEMFDYLEYVENDGRICIRDWKKLKGKGN